MQFTGVHSDVSLLWGGGQKKNLHLDKGYPKNQPHYISIALDLAALNLNGVLNIDFLDIQSKSECAPECMC